MGLQSAHTEGGLMQIERINKGCAGIDGKTIDDLPTLLKQHWPSIKGQRLNGRYQADDTLSRYVFELGTQVV